VWALRLARRRSRIAHRRRRADVFLDRGEKRSFRSVTARLSANARADFSGECGELPSYRYKVARGLRSRAQLGDAGLGVSRTRVRCATRPRHRAARIPRARPPARHREAGPRDRTGGVRLRGIGVVSDPPGKRARARTTTAPVASAARRRRGRSRSRRDELAETSSGDASADVHDAQHPGASPPGREGARAGAAFETETARLASRETAPRGGSSPPPLPLGTKRRSALCAAPLWTRRTAGSSRARAGTSSARGAGTRSWSRPTRWTKSESVRRAAPSTTRAPSGSTRRPRRSSWRRPAKKDPQKNQNLPSERDGVRRILRVVVAVIRRRRQKLRRFASGKKQIFRAPSAQTERRSRE
jgi:hypothetical protein